MSVGRLEHQKNFKGLIKNLSNSKIHLDIVGDGSQKDELKDLASSCNTNLNLIGRLTHEELNKLYSKYRVFILPSFSSLRAVVELCSAPLNSSLL